jgi:hypothetical protein
MLHQDRRHSGKADVDHREDRLKMFFVYVDSAVAVPSRKDGPHGLVTREQAIEIAKKEFIERLQKGEIELHVEEEADE